jgi:ABC-2 type transport system ATP-binding protein
MWTTLSELVAGGTTVLLTTQYLEEADRLADEIVVIDHGRVIAQGTGADLKDRVGGDRLELRLVDDAQADAAIAVLGDVTSEQPTLRDGLVTAAVSRRDGTMIEALRKLDDAGVGVADLTLRRPTLDDVFLTLTGRMAEEVVDDEEAAA